MSAWTYIRGMVAVEPPGSGQHAKEFVLREVLDHLPPVTGSERDMHIEVVRYPGHNSSSNHDEFGQWSNLGRGWNGGRGHSFEEQTMYELVLLGWFRDRHLAETLREWSAWMSRLSKRVYVDDVFVKVWDGYGESRVFDDAKPWSDNFDDWSWIPDDWDMRHWDNKPDMLPLYSERRWADWRYGIGPTIDSRNGNWTENLIMLLPSGSNLAQEHDYLMGNLEPYEYEYFGGSGEYEDEVNAAKQLMDTSLSEYREIEDAKEVEDERRA